MIFINFFWCHSHANLKSNDDTHISSAYNGLIPWQKSKLNDKLSTLPNYRCMKLGSSFVMSWKFLTDG